MRYLKYIVLVMFLATTLYGQNIIGQATGDLRYGRTGAEKEYMAGEHTPLEYSISGTVGTGLVFYTPWFQVGVADGADIDDNAAIQRYNPEYFTLIMLQALYGAGDTAKVTTGKAQYALNPTDTLITVRLRVKAEDTTAVGEVITGSVTGATGIVVSKVTSLTTLLADSQLTCYMYPGNIFTTSDSVGDGTGSDVAAVTYFNTGVIEMADSSNIFIADGNYSHAQYGNWRYEDSGRTDISQAYAIRVFAAAYMRLYLASTVADTTTVTGKLRTEH